MRKTNEMIFPVSSFKKMLSLHQQENKQIFTQLVVYQMKNKAREMKQPII